MAFRVNPTSYTFKPGQPIIISYSGTISNYSYLYGIDGTLRSISSTATTMTFDPVNTKGEYQCYLGTLEEDMQIRSNNFKIIIKDETDVIKENLYNSKKHYDTCYKSLVDMFNSILLKTEVTETDRLNLDVVLLNFRNANSNISTNFEKAVDKIATNKVKESQMETYEVIANVEVKVGEISLKANATQQTLEELDGEVSLIERRVHSAEQKITPEAITNTVSATYTTKNETHELKSVIDQQAGQIREKVSAGYVQQEITKSANQTKFDFSNSGVTNMIRNSSAKGGTINWHITGGTLASHHNINIGSAVSEFFTFNGQNNTNEICASSRRFKLKPNTEYTISGWFHSYTKSKGIDLYVLSSTNADENDKTQNYGIVQQMLVSYQTNGAWRKQSFTFTTKPDVRSGYVRIDNNGYNPSGSNGNTIHWNSLMLVEGKIEKPWTPHAEEIISGNTIIDASGITVTCDENGGIHIKNKAGQTVMKSDGAGNIDFTGRLSPSNHMIKLFGDNCRLDGSMGDIRLQKDGLNYVAVDGSATRFYNGNSMGGNRYTSIYMDSGGTSQIFSNGTMMKLLGGSAAQLQARWTGDTGYCSMAASEFKPGSLRAYKDNIRDPDNIDFIKVLMENDIKRYELKDDIDSVSRHPTVMLPDGTNPIKTETRTGLIIDDLTPEAQDLLNNLGDDKIGLYAMNSTLWKVCQEQQKEYETLQRRLDKIEQLLKKIDYKED